MRRQNRSCDQCRKAKRACDAPSLWDIQRNSERLRNGSESVSGASLAEEHLGKLQLPCSRDLQHLLPLRLSLLLSLSNIEDANQGTCGTSQMRLIPGLYDVHTAFALANNVHFIGFALNYRLAPPLPTPIPMLTPMLPPKMVPTLVAYPINRAQRPSVNGRALNSSSQDPRRLRLLFRPSRLMLTQLPCSICYKHLRRHTT
jgi:hypothetical protein